MKKKDFLIIQPYLTAYRLPIFTELAKYVDVQIISSPPQNKEGYGEEKIPPTVTSWLVPEFKLFNGKLLYQMGLIRFIQKKRPNIIICPANPRYISFWLVLILAKFYRIPVYSWGHGVYKKISISILERITYRLMVKLSKKYICYAPIVYTSMLKLKVDKSKLVIAENALTNSYPIFPYEKTGQENGILFIGRLRAGNDLNLLIEVVKKLREENSIYLTLHIIGDGEESSFITRICQKHAWINWHRQIYQQQQIQLISRQCLLGCYPGNAGLSIVHMMSLSLPPIVHNNFSAHMGPEPAYIQDSFNGFLFDYNDKQNSLYLTLQKAVENREQLALIQKNAYATYEQLTKLSLAERLIKIIEE